MGEFMASARENINGLQKIIEMVKKSTAIPSGLNLDDDSILISTDVLRMAVRFVSRNNQFRCGEENVFPRHFAGGVCISINGPQAWNRT